MSSLNKSMIKVVFLSKFEYIFIHGLKHEAFIDSRIQDI